MRSPQGERDALTDLQNTVVPTASGRAVPLAQAFAAIESHLAAIGRPTTAFAQCELRSPAPFDDQGFVDFNRRYVATLERWGLFRDDVNPVARTNVCPMYDEPREPSMLAFAYTVPSDRTRRPTFMLSGGGDARGLADLVELGDDDGVGAVAARV